MSEWQSMPLRRIASIIDGPHATPKKVGHGPWYLSISSLDDGRLDLSKSAHLSELDYDRWARRAVPRRGDTLFSYETRIGEAAHWDRSDPAVLGRRMAILRPNAEVVHPRFLTYAFLSPQFQEVLRARTVHGATVERLLIGEMGDWPMELPPMPVQRRIVRLLGTLDDLIDLNDRLAARGEGLLAAAFAAAEFDRVGEMELGSLVQVNPFLPRPEGNAPYVDMASLSEDTLAIKRVQFREASGGARFRNGDTLLARITPCVENGKTAFVDCLEDDAIGVGSTEFIVLRAGVGMPRSWPYFLARSPRFRDHIIRNMTGTSGRQRCPAGAVTAYRIAQPDEAPLQAFEGLAGPLLKMASEVRLEASTLRRTRDELLPVLMSGRVVPGEVAS